MIEAGLALCTATPDELHARIAYSLDLLIELERPVYDLHGGELLEGWQPADLPSRLERQRATRDGTTSGRYGLD
jgi:hypothetical protein